MPKTLCLQKKFKFSQYTLSSNTSLLKSSAGKDIKGNRLAKICLKIYFRSPKLGNKSPTKQLWGEFYPTNPDYYGEIIHFTDAWYGDRVIEFVKKLLWSFSKTNIQKRKNGESSIITEVEKYLTCKMRLMHAKRSGEDVIQVVLTEVSPHVDRLWQHLVQ